MKCLGESTENFLIFEVNHYSRRGLKVRLEFPISLLYAHGRLKFRYLLKVCGPRILLLLLLLQSCHIV
jgi:hypothetical protein